MIDGRTAVPEVGKRYLVHMVDTIFRHSTPCPEGVHTILGVHNRDDRDQMVVVNTNRSSFGVSNVRVGWYRTFTPFVMQSPGRLL